ncbi:MAG: N-acetylneuraminate synthase [Rhodospirillaceae bacterium]|nr:N-acetylneuraminate synthase [Rhodospirillales bacterium]
MSCFIIAEAGVNHNGQVELAHRLVEEAARSGVDAIKFQTWKTDLVLRPKTPLVEYQKRNSGVADMYELARSLELADDDFRAIKTHCDELGLMFLSTPFDELSLDFLTRELGMGLLKVPSGEVTNVPYLRAAARTGLPIILSTGMCDLEEAALPLDTMRAVWGANQPDVTILHCTTAYPTPDDDVNLRAMTTLGAHFGLPVGLSDHSEGVIAPLAAVAMGAVMIEKHFTLDRSLPGPDHMASVDPVMLRQMVAGIRTVERMLGTGEKSQRPIEAATAKAVRRSLVARADIAEGAVISADMLVALRPEDGIPARDVDKVVGQPAWRAFKAGEVLQWPASSAS